MSNPIIHTDPNEHAVAMFATRNLYDVLPAAFHSLLAYNPDVHLYLFIETDSLPYMLPADANITTVNVSEQTFFPSNGPCFRTRYTYMVLMKTVMTKVFPDLHRIVLMDVDTITCGSISAMWDYDLTSPYFAAVTEPKGSQIRGIPYPNFGFVLLNLDKLRASGKDNEIINELNITYHPYPEQDAFVKICGNRFDPLPPDYNVTVPGFDITGKANHIIVRHFAGFNAKDWSSFPSVQYWLTHKTPAPRYVVYAGNRKYYHYLIASAKSLLFHNTVDKIFFLIEDDTIPGEDLPPVIQCINVSAQTVFPPSCPNIMPFYSFMTTLRAGLTRILPDDVDRVLWLDPDTVVCDDISDIWATMLDFYYFAAVQEVRNHNHTRLPYYNAGVMLLNLRKMREDGMGDKIITDINTTRYEHLEQDALNFNCSTNIFPLDSSFSDSYVSAPCNHPRIKHFLAQAKAGFAPAVGPYLLPWNELKGVIEYAEEK